MSEPGVAWKKRHPRWVKSATDGLVLQVAVLAEGDEVATDESGLNNPQQAPPPPPAAGR
jgi:hypothetical protein